METKGQKYLMYLLSVNNNYFTCTCVCDLLLSVFFIVTADATFYSSVLSSWQIFVVQESFLSWKRGVAVVFNY